MTVTRTSTAGVAPIHFPSHPHLLPLPRGLHMHIHALSLLAGRTLILSFLVIFPLIGLLLICTISTCWTPGSLLYAPFHSTGTYFIIS